MAAITLCCQCARASFSTGKLSFNLYALEYHVMFGTD